MSEARITWIGGPVLKAVATGPFSIFEALAVGEREGQGAGDGRRDGQRGDDLGDLGENRQGAPISDPGPITPESNQRRHAKSQEIHGIGVEPGDAEIPIQHR